MSFFPAGMEHRSPCNTLEAAGLLMGLVMGNWVLLFEIHMGLWGRPFI